MANAGKVYQEKNFSKIVSKWQSISFRNSAQMFDVIILDLNMPISDGYEACKKIRAMYKPDNLLKQDMLKSKKDLFDLNKNELLLNH